MGGADIGAAILDAVATVKRANPAAKYCCDPVIGDVGRGIFVREGIPAIHEGEGGAGRRYRHAQPVRADYLAGRESRTLADALAAVKAVHELGPRAVLVTSLHIDDTPDDAIDLLASDATGRFRLRTPKLTFGGERGGRRHRRAVLCALSAQRKNRRGAIERGFGDLRRADENRGIRARAEIQLVARSRTSSSSRAGYSRRKNYDGVP